MVRRLTRTKFGVGRVIAKLIILQKMPKDVHAETVDAPAQPEPHDIMHRVADGWIAPVEVGLLSQKGMVIVLTSMLVELPTAAAEI